MSNLTRSGGISSWSIRRPVAVIMLSLTVLVVGLFSFDHLRVNLLPDIIYPDIRVRILEPGTPANIMEDSYTRQLEEQLAITENAVRIQSSTSEGRTAVDLSFPYGVDIDQALQDASTRLDRAKRFLPQTDEAPIIYKRDPSQIPLMELIVSSSERDSIELRSWVDYELSKWFLNIEGVASTEVGGGLVREIQVIVDQEKLAAAGYQIDDIKTLLQKENTNISSGVLYMATRKLSARTEARFQSVEAIGNLPLSESDPQGASSSLLLRDVAQIIDTHQDEELRIRLNQQPGVKLSIQKQPGANTIDVAYRVHRQLDWFKSHGLLPNDIQIEVVDDQSVYVSRALKNAAYAALSGALLAMLVVYIFLRDIRRTLIISSAIPLAIFITFFIMGLGGISLNIMSLGGLALGIGLLVDNTIVMLENISRHQTSKMNNDGNNNKDNDRSPDTTAATQAAAEVTSAITASTTTNLVAVVPFLFIGGLIGLLFSELIITLSAAIIASLIVSLTLVPALGARIRQAPVTPSEKNKPSIFKTIKDKYVALLQLTIQHRHFVLSIFISALALSAYLIADSKVIFFPTMDEGKISVNISTERGTHLEEMDETLKKVESLILQQPDVETAFVSSGGFVFGRSQFQSSNRGSISVQLKPLAQRNHISSKDWIKKLKKQIKKMQLSNYKIRMRVKGIRGIRTNYGDDDFSLRIQGPEISVLAETAEKIIELIKDIPELSNLTHSYEEDNNELIIKIKRQRAAEFGITATDIGEAVQLALNGQSITKYLDGDREFDIRVRMKRSEIRQIRDIENIIISLQNKRSIRLFDVASISINPSPGMIKRDNQLRINEVSASLSADTDYGVLMDKVFERLQALPLPEGYTLYDGGTLDSLRKSESKSVTLLLLAIFLVFVVMAVQYESLTNPLVIILGIPFSLIGVYLAIYFSLDDQLSMPARLGIIMLAGIVVNNAIILVEQIEICRQQGLNIIQATTEAASLRLRPILMTSLTTVFGMLPLAAGLSEGSEMLKPLATIIVYGLSFSLLVSLLVIPLLYLLLHRKDANA
ncbi:Cobalt-zinc-cadmium resistance protein CzcA; Cation efflux system protein CusA [hydrothermal vent metagenome]|uniref:Cobalt-zinc-cadmium resistance protein CzcA Cation efflux system protein CusA n=1 Tax=hydrothermal vent metagenome TaxID=652676 RepID=A0A3B0WZA5_9ZZZZ